MTSREATGFLPLSERRSDSDSLSDWAWRLTFGAIGWPWLLKSLSGGTRAQRETLLQRLGLPEEALPNLGSWKGDAGFLSLIVDHIVEARPATVVELGCGASTLVTAKALAANGGGRLISYDQHRGFCEATRAWVEGHGLTSQILAAPLQRREGDWPGRWYACEELPDRIDMLIVDGPPWSVHPLVRGHAEVLFSRLTWGGVVLLDDASRPGERIVARHWRRKWPDITFKLVQAGPKGTLVGIKRGRGEHASRDTAQPGNDSYEFDSPDRRASA